VLYLGPEPDWPFRDLTVAIWKRFPDHPPYGGRHRDIVPHLSVATLADERELAAVAQDFSRASA
ncbi:MAG: 2'-5' RNA ligase family protein, partial [Desulfuromonadales bacterium]|nr:2'-5' RNA ligase family protein [Desulfuromonadales bacterium]NIS43555.1 2'-5' RNA ligase family protein [Desulfuromonadales bacterium]